MVLELTHYEKLLSLV